MKKKHMKTRRKKIYEILKKYLFVKQKVLCTTSVKMGVLYEIYDGKNIVYIFNILLRI